MAERFAKKIAVTAKKSNSSGEDSGKASVAKLENPKTKRAKIDADPSSHKVPHSGAQGTMPIPTLKGKEVLGDPIRIPLANMSEAEVKEQLRLQGKAFFENRTEAEMKDYLNSLFDWFLGGAMMAQFFSSAISDLAALPKIKKCFHEVATKLQNDKVNMKEAITQVSALTEERDKLNTNNILQQQQLVTEKAEKLKAIAETKSVSEELTAEIDKHKQREKELESEVDKLGKLWEESSEVYFHAAIKQMKYLNPEVELRTRGMSTLSVVEDGKWFRVEANGNLECSPGDEELVSPVITKEVEDVAQEVTENTPTNEDVAAEALLNSDNLFCAHRRSHHLPMWDLLKPGLSDEDSGHNWHFLISLGGKLEQEGVAGCHISRNKSDKSLRNSFSYYWPIPDFFNQFKFFSHP
ncbi:stomatal cytokinesis defective SCD1 protein [Sesbania bispinosa]|nr:stomatal cytokinesis defective SCD1 protein [Sesbania bispinosa]